MKIKTMILVLTLTLTILATDTMAQTFQTSGEGTIEWSFRRSYSDAYSIYLTVPKIKEGTDAYEFKSGPHESRIRILMPQGTKLKDIEEMSWLTYVVAGYPPHADILLDMDGDGEFNSKKDIVTGFLKPGDVDDMLVAEFAYNPLSHYAAGAPYSGAIDFKKWKNTFTGNSDSTNITVNNKTLFWLYSAAPGYPGQPTVQCDYPFISGNLSEWKNGIARTHTWEWNFTGITCNNHVENNVDGNTLVYGMEIEIDGWIAESKCYIDDIEIKGKNLNLQYTNLFQLERPEIDDLKARVFSLENLMGSLKNSVEELIQRYREIIEYLDRIDRYLNTSYGNQYGVPIKGFCGDGICDANLGENVDTCLNDCKDGAKNGEIYITRGWMVTCPKNFINVTSNITLIINYCREEMYRGTELMRVSNLTVDQTDKVNRQGSYSLKLFGIPI